MEDQIIMPLERTDLWPRRTKELCSGTATAGLMDPHPIVFSDSDDGDDDLEDDDDFDDEDDFEDDFDDTDDFDDDDDFEEEEEDDYDYEEDVDYDDFDE